MKIIVKFVHEIEVEGKSIKVLSYNCINKRGTICDGGMISLDLTKIFPAIPTFIRRWHNIEFDEENNIYFMVQEHEQTPISEQLIDAVTSIVMEESFAL